MAKKEEAKKTEVKKEARKSALIPNEKLFMSGEEIEIAGELFVVKQIKGIDVVLSRKDYR